MSENLQKASREQGWPWQSHEATPAAVDAERAAVREYAVMREEQLKRARSQMIVGLVMIVVGLAITIVTFATASGGGTYIVAFGPIIFGVARFLRALSVREQLR